MQVLSDETCRALAGRGDQHPPLVPAELQGRAALPPGLRPRREAGRRDRALRHRRPRRGPDHRAGRDARRPRLRRRRSSPPPAATSRARCSPAPSAGTPSRACCSTAQDRRLPLTARSGRAGRSSLPMPGDATSASPCRDPVERQPDRRDTDLAGTSAGSARPESVAELGAAADDVLLQLLADGVVERRRHVLLELLLVDLRRPGRWCRGRRCASSARSCPRRTASAGRSRCGSAPWCASRRGSGRRGRPPRARRTRASPRRSPAA